jgi:hypothetical protein
VLLKCPLFNRWLFCPRPGACVSVPSSITVHGDPSKPEESRRQLQLIVDIAPYFSTIKISGTFHFGKENPLYLYAVRILGVGIGAKIMTTQNCIFAMGSLVMLENVEVEMLAELPEIECDCGCCWDYMTEVEFCPAIQVGIYQRVYKS